jgi:Flp pilus assembly protein TadG
MSGRRHQSGQVLVLFAGALVGFVALAALAIDLSMVYSLQRTERSLADEAALAGAQDLTTSSTDRTVPAGAYVTARQHALDTVYGALGIAPPATSCTSGLSDADNVIGCPIGPYLVDVKADPSPSYVNVDPYRSVQVTVRNPDVPLTFARLLGQHDWSVGITSVAGLGWGKSYAIVTLRPPMQQGNTYKVNDIEINSNGGSVNVQHGDVGTNANMNYAGTTSGCTGAQMNIDRGYGLYYADWIYGPQWAPCPPEPPIQTVQFLQKMINDPGYHYPDMTYAPIFTDARTSQVVADSAGGPPATLGVERADINADCLALAQSVPSVYTFMPNPMNAANGGNVYCYKPGIYQSGHSPQSAQISVGSGDIALLYPGAYYLKNGMQVNGSLIGGFIGGGEGVALMFDEQGPRNCAQCLNGNSAPVLALNAGTKFPPGTSGVAATAARDWSAFTTLANGTLVPTGTLVDTGTLGPTPPLILTILVKKDTEGPGGTQACVVPQTQPFIEPSACNDSQNQTISIAGGGRLAIEGVMYAPTDNVQVAGSADNNGTVGQIISWSINYTGSSTLNQEGPNTQAPAVLHLDAACSGGNNPCSP